MSAEDACPECKGAGRVGDDACPLGCLVPAVTPADLARLDEVDARVDGIRARVDEIAAKVERMRVIRAERAEA